MNECDRLNLKFLLNASPEVLKEWYDNMSVDDHEYASELLYMYNDELKVKISLLQDDVTDISQASQILQKLYKNK